MSLANIKLNNAQRGFTIVELLIVVVVIAILAAITIVSYNGITTRANASAAKSIAATWQKKIELYQAEAGAYPYRLAQLNNSAKSYHIDGSSITSTPLTAETGKSKVRVQACGTVAPESDSQVTRVEIRYWNYEASTPAEATIAIGGAGGICTGFWMGS